MALRRWVGLLLFLTAGPAFGVVSMTPVSDILLPDWNPAQGDINGTVSFCVQSTQASTTNPRTYRSRLSGNHELVNTVDAGQIVPIRLYHEDFLPPPVREQFVGTGWVRLKKGVSSCTPLVLNAGVRVEIDAIDLGAVTAGTYQGTFTITSRGNGVDNDVFTVQVTIVDSAWIQRLDPIALNYVIGSDASGNEPFCVWSSTGAYDVTISSQTPTASTAYIASGQAVPTNTVNYGVQFDNDADASDGATVTEGTPILNQSTTASGMPASCLGDNTAIRVNFLESGNLDIAPADTYHDELTILIEPR